MSEHRMHPEEMSLGEFNRHMGYKGRFAWQLKNEQRLVMSDDGKRVRVADSIRLINETKDPSRAAVAARHAAGRQGALASAPEEPEDDSESAVSEPGATGSGFKFHDGKAKREHYSALREEIAYFKEVGQLMDADEALGAFADAGARVGAVLDTVPASVGPMLVGQPAEEIVRILEDQMDVARAELAVAVEKLAAEISKRRKEGTA
ncbi:hypothetical protein DR66_4040 [Delftia acidovorans]|nr:hypothetical protein DR66_4040 [Delftia acidovorans]